MTSIGETGSEPPGGGLDARSEPVSAHGSSYELRLPADRLAQGAEWCEVVIGGEVRRIRFHDYAQVYAVAGLYESLFQGRLNCTSPSMVCSLLRAALRRRNVAPSGLRVLDVGAGNGLVADALWSFGTTEIVGVDVLPEAARAASRDRPGRYRDYFVADLADPPADVRRRLRAARFNCVTMVGALGFDDLSPAAFLAALSYVITPGWVAFTLHERYLSDDDDTGFGRLVEQSFADGALRLLVRRRYRHRYSVSGEPLWYVAIIAEKRGDPS